MVVLNSRDRHKKMVTEFYVPQNTPYKKLYSRKADFSCYNSIALILNIIKI